MTPFIFDFTGIKPSVEYVTEQEAENIQKEILTRCPYKVPTVDEIIKLIDTAYTVDKSTFITDVFECGALSISNLVDKTQYNAREEQYKKVITKYNKKEQILMADIFCKIFALLGSVTYDDGRFNDYLGTLFMQCNMGNKKCGQFFTPYHISEFMARIVITEQEQMLLQQKDEIITINDSCCGAGGMMLAALDVLKNTYKINYTRHCFIECSDIDIRCVYMTYLQLSLAGVPAIIYHRDSLTMQTWSVWKTPAFVFQYLRFAKYE